MMAPMRQRLLLVAGWIVAAVGSGVVASGAVAVAGGQVLDRPLQPLTAAEVAALPVVGLASTSVANEPLASGGFDQLTETLTDGSASRAADETDGSVGSVGARGADAVVAGDTPATPALTESRFPESTAVSPDGATNAQSVVIHTLGGAASIASFEGSLRLLWATPRPGYAVGSEFDGHDSLTITFAGSRDLHVLVATIVDGSLVTETMVEPFR